MGIFLRDDFGEMPFLLYLENHIKGGICKSVLSENPSLNKTTNPSYYNIVNISIELTFFYMQSVPIYMMALIFEKVHFSKLRPDQPL